MATGPAKLFQGTQYVCKQASRGFFSLLPPPFTLSSLSRYFHQPAPFYISFFMLVIDRPVTDGKKKTVWVCIIHKQLPVLCLFTAYIQPSRPSSQIILAVNSKPNQI